MSKMFKFEELTCNDEIFSKFIQLNKKKRPEITKYLRDLVSFDYHISDPIQEDSK